MTELLKVLSNVAASRNYASALAGVMATLMLFGVIDHDTANNLVAAIQQMMDGLGQMVAGAKKVYLIAGPIIVIWCAKYAGAASTLKGRLTSITNDPTVKIDGKIIVPPAVADAVPSDKVVAK